MTPAQPRHPLALLADWLELDRAVDTAESTNGRVPGDLLIKRMYAHEALQALDPAALRAQAEAEAGLREALAYYADFDGEHVGALGQYFVRRQALDREFVWRADRGQTARAALAQAGGEG